MPRELVAAIPIVTSKEDFIDPGLLNPSSGGHKFAKLGAITVYQALGTELQLNGGRQVLPDASYMSTDQIFSQFDVEAIDAAEEKARETSGADTTARYFESMLTILLGKEIDIRHITVESIGEFAVHNYGFLYAARNKP